MDAKADIGHIIYQTTRKAPGFSRAVVLLVQEHGGPGLAGQLIGALRDLGVVIGTPKPARKLTPEQRERAAANLAKARAARAAKLARADKLQ